MKKEWFLAALLLFASASAADARIAPPPDMPPPLRDTEPHRPEAAKYYLEALVKDGTMTQEEANRTLAYMVFRHNRRQQDLKDAEGMDKETRRAFMAEKRKERGNPLEEYAKACGLTLERARELMDAMHGSDKGTKYYEKAKQS